MFCAVFCSVMLHLRSAAYSDGGVCVTDLKHPFKDLWKENRSIDMNNIILIGMPGVGKSSIGVILAKELGMQFLDSDLLIQEREKPCSCRCPINIC